MPNYPRLDPDGLEYYTEQMKDKIDESTLEIVNSAGTSMTAEPKLQFDGMNVTNDNTNHKNVVHGQFKVSPTETHWNSLSNAEKNDPNTYWVRLWADSQSEWFTSDKTPIGTIISVAGDSQLVTSPFPTNNYLLCDGTIYNIADYSELAAFFTGSYGAANHFGGDGTTTFAVPDFTMDYPTNGVLCIKAFITTSPVVFCELDDTATDTDKVWSSNKVNNLLTTKQDAIDNNLTTTSKYVTGAINELTSGKQDKLTNPLTQSDVVNNLTSDSTVLPLSAAQGKALYNKLIGSWTEITVSESPSLVEMIPSSRYTSNGYVIRGGFCFVNITVNVLSAIGGTSVPVVKNLPQSLKNTFKTPLWNAYQNQVTVRGTGEGLLQGNTLYITNVATGMYGISFVYPISGNIV